MNNNESEGSKTSQSKGAKKQRTTKSRRKELLACASNANNDPVNICNMSNVNQGSSDENGTVNGTLKYFKICMDTSRRKLINRENKLKRKEQPEISETEADKNQISLYSVSKEIEQDMDLDIKVNNKNGEAKIAEFDKLKIDDDTKNSNFDLNFKINDVLKDEASKQKLKEDQSNDQINRSTDNHMESISKLSRSDSCRVLETMLRIEIKYPQNKVVNLMGEYEDYLEENGLLDVKDVKRRNNIQKKSEEEEDAKSVAEGEENRVDFKIDPHDLNEIPQGTKNLGYYDVLKGMITRMELEGTLGKRREYGRKTKGGKINEERDEEFYYNLDDDFIDDGELVNNESMNRDFSQQEFNNDNDADLDKFYHNFEFLPCETISKFSETIKARKRKRMEDEEISDEKINEKMALLEKAVHENKDGSINIYMQEIALKLNDENNNSDSEWVRYREEILLKLQRIFKEVNRK